MCTVCADGFAIESGVPHDGPERPLPRLRRSCSGRNAVVDSSFAASL